MRRPFALPWLAVGLVVGCQPSISAEADWVQWFPYREITDMASSAEGEIVIVGNSTNDEYMGWNTHRPFFARIDEDGTVLDTWIGFIGHVSSVAMDERAGAYLMVERLRDGADELLPEYCELRALDPEGGTRWTKRWDGPVCPREVVVEGEVVAVLASGAVEAFGLDGRPQWQTHPDPSEPTHNSLATEGTGLWATAMDHRDDGNHVVARRYDLEGRETAQLDVDVGDRKLGDVHPTADGVLLLVYSPISPPPEPLSSPHVQLMSLSTDGQLRWERTVAESSPWGGSHWSRYPTAVTSSGTTPWVVGSEVQSSVGNASESEHPRMHRRMHLQRFSVGGDREGTLRRAFVEAHRDDPEQLDPATLARSECPASDVATPQQFGSVAKALIVHPDGSLLVAGRQGCRDSFVLHLEVE